MMIEIYAVYDLKVEAYHKPFFAKADGEAMRMLNETAMDKTSMLAKYPEDYRLYRIGTYDDSKGQIIPLDPSRYLGDIIEIVSLYKDRKTVQERFEDSLVD